MARPEKWRRVEGPPGVHVFGPVGIPVRNLEFVHLQLDELEALRLLHLEHATQAEAAARMGVSRSTVSRMAERGHRAVTEALVLGKAVRIEGGSVTVVRVSVTGSSETEAGTLVGEAGSTKGERMIIAVPYLDGEVNAHFGSTREFLVAETAEGRVQKSAIYEVQGIQHDHSGIAGFLKGQGVEVIIAGGMGGPMQQALKQAGFNLYCGVAGPATEVVEAFLRGQIQQSEATCGHHHGE
jgi:predicted DNA-binding protein (UPF0251 family)/predicted Fe-Mo cluster-binding NifX family protein